jgi:hypothetical protein
LNKQRTANIGLAIWRLKCFYETFVQGSTAVILLNICAKNPPHRQAENRYKKPFDTVPTWTDSANINGQQSPRAQPHILALSHFSNRVWQPHIKM